jgi:hypothetical protein
MRTMEKSEVVRETFKVSIFTGGEWSETEMVGLDWDETFTDENGQKRKQHEWQMEGFEKNASQVFGEEGAVQLEIYKSGMGSRKGYLLMVTIGYEGEWIYCPSIGAMLQIANQVLPLVGEARKSSREAEEMRHYIESHPQKLLRRGEWNADCSICRAAWERWAFCPER